MLENIQAIYFDLDNTMVDRDTAFQLCIQAFFKQFPDVNFNMDHILEMDNSGYNKRVDFCDELVSKYDLKETSSQDVFDYLILNIGNYVKVNESVSDLLTSLARKYQLGIITNGSNQNQMRKIANAHLDNIFSQQAIYISQDYKVAKPNSSLFEIVLKDLDIAAENLLFVGDNPIDDIWGASQLDINTCWVSHNREWKAPFCFDISIETVAQLKEIVL